MHSVLEERLAMLSESGCSSLTRNLVYLSALKDRLAMPVKTRARNREGKSGALYLDTIAQISLSERLNNWKVESWRILSGLT